LTDVSDKALITLAEGKFTILVLDSLTTISDDVAEALARHEGKTKLRGLTSLSDAAARAFANHKGGLDFSDRLTDISQEAIAVLRANPHGVSLPRRLLEK
jgi:hypothetical protein